MSWGLSFKESWGGPGGGGHGGSGYGLRQGRNRGGQQVD